MGFFDDDNDPFEDILNEFFGGRRGPKTSSYRRVVSSESEERVIDYIEEKDYIYFVFEIPGFEKQDIEIKLKGDTIIVKAKKRDLEKTNNYLKDKLSMGVEFQKTIPVRVKKDYEWTFKNGILEVKFKRK